MRVISRDLLSATGSTRGTAYSMSSKIVSAGGKVFVAWLDHVSEIMARTLDAASGVWSEPVHLGTGADNHSGPAVTMDSERRLYAAFGPHFGPFQFVRSSRPGDASEWERLPEFGLEGTYPSLVCAPDDSLHCAYRGGEGKPARLIYQKLPAGGGWTEPRELVTSGLEPEEGEWKRNYTQYGNSLAAGPDGTLNLAFHIYDERPPGGKAVGYMRSEDGGETWLDGAGREMRLPAGRDAACVIECGPGLDMRIGNVAVDAKGLPWLTTVHLERRPPSVVLWRLDGGAWREVDLVAAAGGALRSRGLCAATMTFDAQGVLYVAAATVDGKAEKAFGHPSCEVVLLTSVDRGESFEVTAVSEPDPENPSWLPSIERPFGARPIDGPPALLYTHGGPGEGTTGGDATEVFVARLG